jgi:hypothetical protein
LGKIKCKREKVNDKNGTSSEEDGKREIVIILILILTYIYIYIYIYILVRLTSDRR